MRKRPFTLKAGKALALAGCATFVVVLAAPPPAAGKVKEVAMAAVAVPAAGEGSTLEQAAKRAGETGRKVALSLIALGFAVAAIVLAFKRDFKEAVAVFAIGVIAVLFAQATGLKLVENLVRTVFGG